MSYELAARQERRVSERYVPVKQAFIIDHERFGVIKNISLGGIAMYCLNDSRVWQNAAPDVFLASSAFSLLPEQFTFVSRRPTSGQAIIINHISFKSLSPAQLDSLWSQINSSCLRADDWHAPEDEYRSPVSLNRQRDFHKKQAPQAKHPRFLSQNSDKTPPFHVTYSPVIGF